MLGTYLFSAQPFSHDVIYTSLILNLKNLYLKTGYLYVDIKVETNDRISSFDESFCAVEVFIE